MTVREHISISQIKRLAPSAVLKRQPMKHTGRYSFIPTYEIVEGLVREGFKPVAAAQSKIRNARGQKASAHFLTFDLPTRVRAIDGFKPSLILINSYDRTQPYRFMLTAQHQKTGASMVVATDDVGSVSFRHRGKSLTADVLVKNAVEMVDESVPKIVATLKAMTEISLLTREKNSLVREMVTARWPTAKKPPLDVDQLTEGTEDTFLDVYSTAHQHLIEGGLVGLSSRNKPRKMKAVTAPFRRLWLSVSLWDKAQEVLRKHAKHTRH